MFFQPQQPLLFCVSCVVNSPMLEDISNELSIFRAFSRLQKFKVVLIFTLVTQTNNTLFSQP